MSERRLFLFGLSFELALGMVGLLGGALTGIPALGGARIELRAIAIGLAATLPLLAFFIVAWRSQRRELREIRARLERLLPQLLGGLGVLEWLGVVALAIAAGIGEELLFRGFLQGSLEHVLGTTVGLLAASLVFGLIHAITPAYAVIATFMGVYLGTAWHWSGNLVVPITIHAAYDAAVIWFVMYDGRPSRDARA